MRTLVLTAFALLAFSANSILGRLALRSGAIDAASYTSIRLASGAVLLVALLLATRRTFPRATTDSLRSALALFAYAILFSFAYRTLPAGTGALLLFGAVQVTMIGAGLQRGERPHIAEWTGLVLALGGLVVLAAPDLSAPPLVGTGLMVGAGIAWGVYSLMGKGVSDPIPRTAFNFAAAAPLALVVSAVTARDAHATPSGILLAVTSGAIASALGYVIWYAALRGLTSTRAAIIQLATPVLTAAGGVIFLAETITSRLVLAAVMILGGVALSIARGAQTRKAG